MLCERIGYPPEFAGIGYGLCVVALHRSKLRDAFDAAARLKSWGEERGDIRGNVLGLLYGAQALMGLGQLAGARSELEQALSLFELSLQDPKAIWSYRVSVSGARVSGGAHGHLAHVLCILGWPEQALAHVGAIGSFPETEIVVVSEVLDIWLRLRVRLALVDPTALMTMSEQMVRLCRGKPLPMFRSRSEIAFGYLIARLGEAERGRAVIAKALADYWASEALEWSCFYRALLAETHQMLGESEVALRTLGEALNETQQTGERWYDAELHRRIGDVHRQTGDHDAARRSFEQALTVARAQQAKLWELQAATSCARLLRDEGQPAEAHAILAPVYAWFTEGFDTVPLRNARAVLDELGGIDA
jgi:tetratricopeptide (TPR) repeat protein